MIQLININKTYSKYQVFSNFNLEVPTGELVSVYGPNGCGKTTLLNLIAGVQPAEQGEILFNHQDKFKVGYIFQNYRESLLPWLTVEDNISFPLLLQKVDIQSRRVKAKELLKKFAPHINSKAYPYQLSGGQQQLVALLRGLIVRPDIYLLDEPFSSFDYQTSLMMLKICVEILKQEKLTAFFVSHDGEEAVFFSTTIVVLAGNPTKVVKVFKNDLPFPRTLASIDSPSFINLKKDIMQAINTVN
ncbi:MAG: ABC transporter ATP-binding protein [Patescibacteria group bacterium]|nr:ABC transporter ATP-binding protein [Patescibacteria group bacterium]